MNETVLQRTQRYVAARNQLGEVCIESTNLVLPKREYASAVETQRYKALLKKGLADFAFKAVILRYPEVFSAEAEAVSRERLADWRRS